MTYSPQLTSLKSTREVSGPKSIRPDEYFSIQHPAKTFEFGDLLHWKAFPLIIERNLHRLKSLPKQEDSVTSVLLDNHIQAVFEETQDSRSEYILGPVNAVLLDKSEETVNPLLIGHFYEDSQLDAGISKNIYGINSLKASCPGPDADGPSWLQSVKYCEREPRTNEMMAAVRHLFHILAMNKLSFGFIYTRTCLRVVKLSIYRNEFELMISPLVSVQDRTATLAALCVEAYLGNSGLKSLPPIELLPMTVETPSVYPLSSYEEGSAGHIKWWVARKINRRKYKISFEAEHRNLYRINGVFWIQGMVFIEGSESLSASSGLSKFADLILAPQDDNNLRHSTSMMIYLNDNKIKCVPEVLAYGYMHQFQVLALAPFGKPIVIKDVEEAFIEELMHHALSELHDNGVMLVEISLECFAFDARASPPVRIFGFPKAKLVRNVPSIARRLEHDMLRKVVAQ